MNELKVTADKVLEAAQKCPQAKEALKTLFPEVFIQKKPELYIFEDSVTITTGNACQVLYIGLGCLIVRDSYKLDVISNKILTFKPI